MVTPGALVGTMISDLLAWTGPSPVLASRHSASACAALVIHILLPLMT
jgi:hypothetical protein